MPFAAGPAGPIHFKQEGDAAAPSLLLLNSIGTDMELWAPVLPALRVRFRLLRIDTRGHGASAVPAGNYAMSDLAADIVAVMETAGVSRAAVAGVSLGGMIAMQLALDHPARVTALALIATSATMDPATWQARMDLVQVEGMAPIADLALSRFFSPGFIAGRPEIVATIREGLLAMSADGYAGCAAAIRDMALAGRLGEISCPTLVVTGSCDVSTPFAGHGEYLLSHIAGARHASLEGAHLLPLEAPEALTKMLNGHGSSVGPYRPKRRDTGRV